MVRYRSERLTGARMYAHHVTMDGLKRKLYKTQVFGYVIILVRRGFIQCGLMCQPMQLCFGFLLVDNAIVMHWVGSPLGCLHNQPSGDWCHQHLTISLHGVLPECGGIWLKLQRIGDDFKGKTMSDWVGTPFWYRGIAMVSTDSWGCCYLIRWDAGQIKQFIA